MGRDGSEDQVFGIGAWVRPAVAALLALAPFTLAPGEAPAEVVSVQTYDAPGSSDQDDMAFWVHPTDPSLSTIITADKGSGDVYVYDLDGTVLQAALASRPGNIDVRYGIPLGGQCVDLVAFNDRDEDIIRVYRVEPSTRMLVRVDTGNIVTGSNYGFTLYKRADGSLYGFTGGSGHNPTQRQYLLEDNGLGQIGGSLTGWQFHESLVEGMVGDDETGYIYLGEEHEGIWRVHATDSTDKTLIAQIGDASGLAGDVEGLTIYHGPDGQGYLIASSQSESKFTVLDRVPPHTPVGEFSIVGVGETDGIDVLNLDLGSTFSQGIFAAHSAAPCCTVEAARWEDIAAELGGLLIDTESWHPRQPCGPLLSMSRTELFWTAAAPAVKYDVVQGDLPTLLATDGDFGQATLECLANDLEDTSLTLEEVTPVVGGYWYLVRGVASFGDQTFGSYGASQAAPRDAGIENVCQWTPRPRPPRAVWR